MSPKYLPLCVLVALGLVLLATTSVADDVHVNERRRLPPRVVRPPLGKRPPSVEESTKETFETTTHDGKTYKPPNHGHHPPNTQSEPSKFEHTTTVEDGYKPSP